MRYLKLILTALMVTLLLLSPLTSCKNPAGGENGGDPSDDTTERPVVIDPEDTAPTIVASPSLGSVSAIREIGVEGNGIILEAGKSAGNGMIYDGLNANGKRLWKASPAEKWVVNPNAAIPEGFSTLVVPVGTEVTVYNHTAHEVSADYYMNFSSGETYAPDKLPSEAGVYIRVVTVNVPRPTSADPDPEIGAFFGEYIYLVVVALE